MSIASDLKTLTVVGIKLLFKMISVILDEVPMLDNEVN